ncbi:MAG: SRPBCC family protein [Planctomycetes bacterium]|nr:SRPBCC family protein [Planctomycetota bacterium]
MAGKGSDRHVFVTYIRTTPAKLWRAITTGAVTKKWYFRCGLHGKPKKGSELRYILPDGNTAIVGKVLEAKPRTKLVHLFKFVGWNANEPASRVTYEIAQDGPAVRLTVIHDRLAKSPKTAADVTGGWPVILSSLKSLLETGKALF